MGKILRDLLAKTAIAAAVGFLGAIPMASAAGFYHDSMANGTETPTLLTSGFILFCVTMALVGPIVRCGSSLIDALGRCEARPGPAVALGLIAAGTLCVIASLGFAWSARATNAAAEGMSQMLAQMKGSGVSNFNFNLHAPDPSSSAGPMVLTILAFLLGASLIGLGVWSSLGVPRLSADAYANNHAMKVPIPAADESRL